MAAEFLGKKPSTVVMEWFPSRLKCIHTEIYTNPLHVMNEEDELRCRFTHSFLFFLFSGTVLVELTSFSEFSIDLKGS